MMKYLVMPCTKEQYERDLKGRVVSKYWELDSDALGFSEGYENSVIKDLRDGLVYADKLVLYTPDESIKIEYNPDCFIGVVLTNQNSQEVNVGEYLYCLNDAEVTPELIYQKGEVVRVEEILHYFTGNPTRGSFGPNLNNNCDLFRKATVEEIINYFFPKGYKESEGKLEYELEWNFIEAMAKRMQTAKKKYGKDNWKKPIEVNALKQSLIRHGIEVMKDAYEDDGSELGHLEALACNAMMLWYQLKNNKQ